MVTRSRRIELRADPLSAERIASAAESESLSMSAFVLAAATREADRVLGRVDQTAMPAAQFDALVAALDEPEPASRLARAAADRRRYTRA